MKAEAKAYELINKVSDGQLPYSYAKALAILICDEIISMSVGRSDRGEEVEEDELCADEEYWKVVRSIIDNA